MPSVKNRRFAALCVLMGLFPALLVLFTLYRSSNYALMSLLAVLLALVPFLLAFEHKKPRAREWLPLAVMAAVAAVGRMLFAWAPSVTPVSAIVVITALAFGAESGFLTGAVAALASNLFFGQGPWTPWQMFAWGLIGFLGGLLGRKNLLRSRAALAAFGVFTGLLYGWIMNVWSGLGYGGVLTGQLYLALCATSLPLDLIHGASTAAFLLLLEKPWGAKLRRVRVKFGLLRG